MNIDAVTFVILGFACFRITHLIVSDEFMSFFRALLVDEVNERDAQGRWIKLQYPKLPMWRAYIGALISCPWCTGVWVGALLVTGWYFIPNIIFPISLVFAVSGLGVTVEMATKYWSINSFSPNDEQVKRINEINSKLTRNQSKYNVGS